ncbi:PAS domain-containing protein [Saliniradius amylolyticus]|uniref:PAS domain-containing hybrid sensor histidine kinase/response regulator n=1 Tax=Saliniradius amylolyticus TaxID=2183582 RepID=UPI0013A57C76|nr:PAS domain-containing protein [Saliniradius amylolyticus]
MKEQLVDQFDVLMDAIPNEVALLDSDGRIIALNQAWQQFADENQLTLAEAGLGANYLDICCQASEPHQRMAHEAFKGVSEVLTGQRKSFEMNYPCQSQTAHLWFKMRVTPVPGHAGFALMEHWDVTPSAARRTLLELDRQLMKLGGRDEPELQVARVIIERLQAFYMGCRALMLISDNSASGHRILSGDDFPGTLSESLLPLAQTFMTSVLSGARPYIEDCRSEVQHSALAELLLAHGYESVWSAPVRIHQDEQAVVLLLHCRAQRPSKTDRMVINKLSRAAGQTLRRLSYEQRLRRYQREFHEVYRHAPVGIALAEADGRLCSMNPAWLKMIGLDESLMYQNTIFDWVKESDHFRLKQSWKRLLKRDQTSARLELRFDTGHREPFWVRLNASVLSEDNGASAQLVLVCEYVHQYKRLQEQLGQAEQRFRYVAQATADAIWDWDIEADECWWSPGFYDMFGLSPSHAPVDKNFWRQNIHPDEQASLFAELKEFLAGDAIEWRQSYRFRRQDGSYARVKDKGYVLRNDKGQAVRMVGGISDVTKEYELEEKLRQSYRMEAVGQLTGGVAHDFNNLLTVIIGNSELLQEEVENSDAPLERETILETLELVLSAGRSGADLTQRLLAFARKQSLEPEVLDVLELLTDMDPILRRTLGDRVEFNWDLHDSLWHVEVDPSQLQNAILNLCLNAVDAMPGGGRLTIEASNIAVSEGCSVDGEMAPGEYVLLSVSDTGHGMDDQQQQRIFEPFYTSKPKGEGSGLGLSMVFGFVKQSQGYISLSSAVGEGARFQLYLPKYEGQAAPTRLRPDHDPEVSGRLRSVANILVVEDDTMVRQYVAQVLVRAGFNVKTASCPSQALAIFERQPAKFHLLITDVMMPEVTGFELAERIQAESPRLPVLFISGYNDSTSVSQQPDRVLLCKPFKKETLLKKVQSMLSTSSYIHGNLPASAANRRGYVTDEPDWKD